MDKSRVHAPGDIPAGLATPNKGDDSEAAVERDPQASREIETRAPPRPWRAAASLLVLKSEVNEIFPGRSIGWDGIIGDAAHQSRNSDHNPWVTDGSNGVVTAIDITHDPQHGCDAGQLAEKLREGKDKRIKYVIWNRRIANFQSIGGEPPWAWRKYTGANPHDHHVHVSVREEKEFYDSKESWKLKPAPAPSVSPAAGAAATPASAAPSAPTTTVEAAPAAAGSAAVNPAATGPVSAPAADTFSPVGETAPEQSRSRSRAPSQRPQKQSFFQKLGRWLGLSG